MQSNNRKRSLISITISFTGIAALAAAEIFTTTVGFIWAKFLERCWRRFKPIFRDDAVGASHADGVPHVASKAQDDAGVPHADDKAHLDNMAHAVAPQYEDKSDRQL